MAKVCPDDGYEMMDATTFEKEEWGCSNPWHPHHPGRCPNCGHEGNHPVAGMGMQEAACEACDHQVKPPYPMAP